MKVNFGDMQYEKVLKHKNQRFGSGSTRIHCIWPDPDPGKEIEVDPDPDPRRGLKWIRIRPKAVVPGGSGSETLILNFTK